MKTPGRACLLLVWLAGAAFAAEKPAGEKPAAAGPESPRAREYSYIYDVANHSLVRPITRVLDVPLLARKVAGQPREAANVDESDQVRLPSTWWQPRLGFRPVSVEQLRTGPGPGTGPAPGKWIVTKAKTQGVTPGFQIKDSKGDRFIIKFDSPKSPELATSVDVVGSILFWGAGYNVPENTIAFFRPEDLVIAGDATYQDPMGLKKPMTQEYLDRILASVARLKDGRFRCVASKFLAGKPLGPYRYNGRRKDDPEDLIPHELRRELRGLWTLCAWVNHADSRGANTLDAWVTDGGRSFVRHHLIDFSALLGAGPNGRRSQVTGTEYYLDYRGMSRQVATLGLVPFAWEPSVDPEIVSVGFVESAVFDPGGWRPDYPNPAFDDRTVRDIRWGARILAGFTDEHIRAAVEAGRYSDPRAADYLVRVLIERRDQLIDHWLGTGHRPQGTARVSGSKPAGVSP